MQQRVAMTTSDEQAESATILLQLARNPVWLAGVGTYAFAYLVQAAALGIGRLVVVQPILATTIVFALPLGARLSAQRITQRDVAAAFLVTAALGAFLFLSNPAGGREDAPLGQWAIVGGAVIAVALLLAGAGERRSGALKAALIGTAAGLCFGLVSALTKGAVEVLEDDGIGLLANWHIYAVLGIGAIGMTLTQRSLQTGVLPPAIATSSIFNPALSVALGLTLFEERIHQDALGSAACVAALLVMFAGVAVLALGQARPAAAAPVGSRA